MDHLCRKQTLLRPCDWSLSDVFPVLPHRLAGADCNGCLQPDGSEAQVRVLCNVCGGVVGEMHGSVLLELVCMISGRATDRYLELISEGDLKLPSGE